MVASPYEKSPSELTFLENEMFSVKNAARRLKREGNEWYQRATSDDIFRLVARHSFPRSKRAELLS